MQRINSHIDQKGFSPTTDYHLCGACNAVS